jgi:hypothetical protein
VVGAVNGALAPLGLAANHAPLTPEWVLSALGRIHADGSVEPAATSRPVM